MQSSLLSRNAPTSRRYRPVRVLGKGSGGVATLVTDASGAEFVLKQISITSSSLATAQEEVKLLSLCHHPYIVALYSSWSERSKICLLMEFCRNGDLAATIAARRKAASFFAEAEVCTIAAQVSSALCYLHARRILHRDVKPGNIFLHGGVAKLGDLGVSRLLSESASMAATQVGTPLFMSPQVFCGEGYTSSTDLYALGCVLYETCCLRPPFEGESLQQLMATVLAGRYKPVSGVYSSALRALIDSLLSRDAQARPTAAQVLTLPVLRDAVAALRPVSDDAPVLPTRTSAPTAAASAAPLLVQSSSSGVGHAALQRICAGTAPVTHASSPAPSSDASSISRALPLFIGQSAASVAQKAAAPPSSSSAAAAAPAAVFSPRPKPAPRGSRPAGISSSSRSGERPGTAQVKPTTPHRVAHHPQSGATHVQNEAGHRVQTTQQTDVPPSPSRVTSQLRREPPVRRAAAAASRAPTRNRVSAQNSAVARDLPVVILVPSRPQPPARRRATGTACRADANATVPPASGCIPLTASAATTNNDHPCPDSPLSTSSTEDGSGAVSGYRASMWAAAHPLTGTVRRSSSGDADSASALEYNSREAEAHIAAAGRVAEVRRLASELRRAEEADRLAALAAASNEHRRDVRRLRLSRCALDDTETAASTDQQRRVDATIGAAFPSVPAMTTTPAQVTVSHVAGERHRVALLSASTSYFHHDDIRGTSQHVDTEAAEPVAVEFRPLVFGSASKARASTGVEAACRQSL